MAQPPGWTPPEQGPPDDAPGQGGSPQQPPGQWGTPQPPPGQWGTPQQPPGQWGPAPNQWGGWGQPVWQVKPGVIPLRPLGVGEILDGALATIRHYPRATLGLSAVVVTLTQLLNFLVLLYLITGIDTAVAEQDFGSFFASAMTAGALTFVVTLIAQSILSGCLTVVLGEAVLGRPITLEEAWRRVRPRLGALIGASLLTALILAGAFLLCVVPFFYFWPMLSLATPALILERQPVTRALRRSMDLVRGDFWRVLGISLLAWLIAQVVGLVLSLPFALLGGAGSAFGVDAETATTGSLAVQTIGGIIAGTITSPFRAGVAALLYVDRRMRSEGLDVALAQAAAAGPPPA